MAGSIPRWGTYLGLGFDPWLKRVLGQIIHVFLSLLAKISISSGEDLKKWQEDSGWERQEQKGKEEKLKEQLLLVVQKHLGSELSSCWAGPLSSETHVGAQVRLCWVSSKALGPKQAVAAHL